MIAVGEPKEVAPGWLYQTVELEQGEAPDGHYSGKGGPLKAGDRLCWIVSPDDHKRITSSGPWPVSGEKITAF